MALKTGGNRLFTSYKVTTDDSVIDTMVVDVTGGSSTLYGFEIVAGGALLYFRLYDSSAPVSGTTVPKMAFIVPASSTLSVNIPEGISFTNGISYNATGGDCDPATTTTVANADLFLYST
jgi:hypothetical protein